MRGRTQRKGGREGGAGKLYLSKKWDRDSCDMCIPRGEKQEGRGRRQDGRKDEAAAAALLFSSYSSSSSSSPDDESAISSPDRNL